MPQFRAWFFDEKETFHPLAGVNTTCIDLNGTNERMETTGSNLGVSNTWTLGFWVKWTGNEGLMSLGNGLNSAIFSNDGTGTILNVKLRGGGGPAFMDQNFASVITGGWHYITGTWNGTTFRLYNDGVETTSSPQTPSGSMSEGSREVFMGTGINGGDANFEGRWGHCALWSSVLTDDEVTEVYNGLFDIDLNHNTGDYVSESTLVSFWRPGAQSPSNIGKDYTGSNDANQLTNVDFNDVVTDSPS